MAVSLSTLQLKVRASPLLAATAAAATILVGAFWAFRRKSQKKTGEDIPGLKELNEACNILESQLVGTQDGEKKRRLRKVLWHAYSAIDALYESSGRPRHSRTTDDASVCSSDSFLSVSNLEMGHFADEGPEEPAASTHDIDLELAEATQAQPPANVIAAIPPVVNEPRPYDYALPLAASGHIRCRKIRLREGGCSSEQDFLACVYSIREAFARILGIRAECQWLHGIGRDMMARLIRRAQREDTKFIAAYEAITAFVTEGVARDGGTAILHELSGRGVSALSFYDLVLDFTFLDALEDLENPPSALTAAMNAWVPAVVKQKMLIAAVGIVISAKRSRGNPGGFIHKYYDVMEEVSPVMAWGLLGSDEPLKAACSCVKDNLLRFNTNMFSLARTAPSTASLAESILQSMHANAVTIDAVLGAN